MTTTTTAPAAERTFAATISTAARVRRDGQRPDASWGPWTEILDPAGADLHRLPGGPLLLDHLARTDFQVGVIEAARVENGKVVATVRFGSDAKARQIAADVADRVRRQLSVGYAVEEWTREGARTDAAPTFRATKWTPMEVSVVALGADTGATFRSSEQPELRTRAMNVTTSPAAEVAPVIPDTFAEAHAAEAARVEGINLTVRKLALPADSGDTLIAAAIPLDAARKILVERWAAGHAPASNAPVAYGMQDHTDPQQIIKRMSGWLSHRLSGGRLDVPPESREFAGASLIDMGRTLMQARGTRQWLSMADVTASLLGRGGMHTTSDFALLAGTSANRALLDRFQQLAPALLPIARKQTVPDFRSVNRIRLGEGSDLTVVNEHGEITRGVVRERGETYSVASYAKIFAFTRKLIVNDDLGAFEQFISEIGAKAAVVLGNVLFDVLNNNALMSDGVALFASVHGNLATTPATIDATSLNVARVAMWAQLGVDGGVVGAAPRYLIVGPAKQTAAETMLATLAPTSTSDVNVFAGKLELIVEPRITGNAWYLAADPSVVHGLEYAELDGSRSMGGSGPNVETRVGFDIEGLEVKVVYDVGAGAVAYQPLFKNAGA